MCIRSITDADHVTGPGEQKYHGACFACSGCCSSLKGQPFFELDGKLLCEKDFVAASFTDMCAKCLTAITDEVVEANGKNYHSHCFVCSSCNKSLVGGRHCIGPNDGKFYCEKDYLELNSPVCVRCKEKILRIGTTQNAMKVRACLFIFHFMLFEF